MKPQLPTEIYLAPDDAITWTQYCIKAARELNIAYAKSKLKFTKEIVEQLAYTCLSDNDLPDDSHPDLWNALEQVCRAIEQSKVHQLNMTHENITEQPVNSPKTALEGVVTTEQAEDTVTPEAQAQIDAYNATLDSQIAEQTSKREGQQINSQEIAIITAAQSIGTSISLEDARAELSKKFDLGNNNTLRPLGTLPITPADLGKAMVYGAKVEQGGAWIYADGVNMLTQLGFEKPVEQIAAMLGKSDSTLYNYARTARRIPKELRDESVPITVYSEIVNRKYDEDEGKNTEIITELANQAVAEKWSCLDARSHADLKQGKEPKEKRTKYRYLQILNGEPMLCIEEPLFTPGVIIVDLKVNEWLRDLEGKIGYCKIAMEPSDAQLKGVQ